MDERNNVFFVCGKEGHTVNHRRYEEAVQLEIQTLHAESQTDLVM